jgi:hypothetical protein
VESAHRDGGRETEAIASLSTKLRFAVNSQRRAEHAINRPSPGRVPGRSSRFPRRVHVAAGMRGCLVSPQPDLI